MQNDQTASPVGAAGNVGYLPYWKAILCVLISPQVTFKSFVTKPRWVIPVILCVIAAIISEAATSRYRMAEARERILSSRELSAEEIERRVSAIDSQAVSSIKAELVALAFVIFTALHMVKLLGMSLFLWLGLHLFKNAVKFVSILSVASFSFLVQLPEAALKIPLIISKESTRVFLGPAVFLPTEWYGSILFRFVDKLDIFNLWMAGLLILGISNVTDIRRNKVLVTVIYLFVIWLVFSSLFGDLVQIG